MRQLVYLSFFTICLCAVSVQNLNARADFLYVTKTTANTFQGRNSITGFVFGESRTPVSNVYVELQTDTYSPLARMQTNGSGLYSFRGLSAGQYIIKVIPSGTDYAEQTNTVSLIPVSVVAGSGAMSEQIDFYLKMKKRKNTGPLASPGVVFVQEIPTEAIKMYEAGIDDLANKKEDAGFAKLKQSLEVFPDYFLALDRLGTEYVMRGYYRPGSILLAKATTVNPRSFSSRFGLGLATYRLNEIDEAVKHFKNSITINSDSVNAHLWLGIALHSKNNLSEALISMLQADKLSGGTAAEVHWQLARVYKDQKKFRKAADELELFLKYKPDAQNFNEIKQIIKTLRQKE